MKVVNQKLNNIPGLFRKLDGQEVILVNSKYKNNPYIIGAILAHEIVHLFLISRNNIYLEESEYENEIFTDIASIHLGLDILIINGMKYKNHWFMTVLGSFFGCLCVNIETLSFGYFKPKQYGQRFKKYCSENYIDINMVACYINPNAWHFIKLPVIARFRKASIFYKESLNKLLLNILGIIIIVILFIVIFF